MELPGDGAGALVFVSSCAGAFGLVLAFVLVMGLPISPYFRILRGTGLLGLEKKKRSFS